MVKIWCITRVTASLPPKETPRSMSFSQRGLMRNRVILAFSVIFCFTCLVAAITPFALISLTAPNQALSGHTLTLGSLDMGVSVVPQQGNKQGVVLLWLFAHTEQRMRTFMVYGPTVKGVEQPVPVLVPQWSETRST